MMPKLRTTVENKTEDRPYFRQRSRMDIIACILENSDGRLRKTRIIYKCNLTLPQFNVYKDFLDKIGLVEAWRRKDGTEIFETTGKGKEFLDDYKKIKNALNKAFV